MTLEVIDRYKLLQELGEGGFGVVYQAEQTEPVQRIVALKIIKPGMDTRQVIARFEAERQALALMDHPNIAKVLDAGSTEQGRPYFVMELVKGIPITEYCDQAKLDTAARLTLFQQVCYAVQHAHQKGIIHRDLKPSNVLVALHDGKPVPKVIDFGIAKATDRKLTDKTLFTEFKQMIGTPEYMAPEQAEMSGLDVDTRADVYSLGVLLYELLTGTKPFDIKELIERGYDEVLRTLREVDPEKPSTRVSTMGDDLAAVAGKRHTPARLLGKTLRGDLDWIVMKALEKDRSRRYETANGLAADLDRYLTDRPVSAGAPGALYRARKYVRRHRVGVAATSLVTIALVAGVVFAFSGYVEAADQRDRGRASWDIAETRAKEAEQTRALEAEQRALAEEKEAAARTDAAKAKTAFKLLDEMLGSANPHQVKGRNYTVRQLLDDFDRRLGDQLEDQPEVELSVRRTMGSSYAALGAYDPSEKHLRAAVDLARRAHGPRHWSYANTLTQLAGTLRRKGRYADALRLHEETLAIARDMDDDQWIGTKLVGMATTLLDLGRTAEAEKASREALERLRRAHGGPHADIATCLSGLSLVLTRKGQLDEAEACAREALAMHRALQGGDHPNVASGLHNLAVILGHKGDMRGQYETLGEALRVQHRIYGEEHPMISATLQFQAQCALYMRLPDAVDLAERCLAMRRKLFDSEHPLVAEALSMLSQMRMFLQKDYAGCEALRSEALAIFVKAYEPDHIRISQMRAALGQILYINRKYDEARALLEQALAALERHYGDREHLGLAFALGEVAEVYKYQGQFELSEKTHRRAYAIRKKYHPVHAETGQACNNVGRLNMILGRCEVAVKFFRECLEIRRKVFADEKHWAVRQSRGDLANAERAVGLLKRAPDTLTTAETFTLAELRYHRKEYSESARLYRAGLAEDSSHWVHRYNAACVFAILLRDAKGEEADRLRAETLRWLRINLETRRGKTPEDRRQLEHWKGDPDLAAIRDGDLPKEWRALWREVDALLK